MRTSAFSMLPEALGQVEAKVGLKFCGDDAVRVKRAMTSMTTERRVMCVMAVATGKRRISGE